jgi:branched-subunit amino acid transport protein
VSAWVVVIAAGIVTFATRLSFIALLPHDALPDWFKRALRFVPVAVLAAIIFPELLVRGGELSVGLQNSRLLAGLAAVAVAWKTKRTMLTIFAGMVLLWFLEALGKL